MLTVHAGNKSFVGPGNVSAVLPVMPQSELADAPPVKVALRLQDMPGAKGVAHPSGELWQIVLVDGEAMQLSDSGTVNPKVFDKSHWREVCFSGALGSDGLVPLTPEQQTELFHLSSRHHGALYVICGLIAMPLSTARWTNTASQTNPKRILDALNFAQDGTQLGDFRSDLLTEAAKDAASARGVGQLKPGTDA
jgi:type VI secretion system secreted protein VgrG